MSICHGHFYVNGLILLPQQPCKVRPIIIPPLLVNNPVQGFVQAQSQKNERLSQNRGGCGSSRASGSRGQGTRSGPTSQSTAMQDSEQSGTAACLRLSFPCNLGKQALLFPHSDEETEPQKGQVCIFNLGLSSAQLHTFPCIHLNLPENTTRGHAQLHNAVHLYLWSLIIRMAPK